MFAPMPRAGHSAVVSKHSSDATLAQTLTGLAALALVIVPWLNPFAPGPTPALVPQLVSWACAGALLMLPSASKTLSAVPLAWMLAGLVSSAIALCQYGGVSDALVPWINRTEIGQAFGNLRQRNQLATLANIALASLIAIRARGPATLSLASTMAAALLAVGMAATSSRTGLLQLLLLAAIQVGWYRRSESSALKLLAVAMASYAAASVCLPLTIGLDWVSHGVLHRLATELPVCASRLTLWDNVLHLIAQKPWIGWGWGGLDYAHYVTLYPGNRFCDILDNAHNLPLHLAVELGTPLASLLCVALTLLLWRAKPWRAVDANARLAWSVVLLIGIHSLLEYPLWYGPFQIAMVLCIGMLWPRAGAEALRLRGALVHRLTCSLVLVLWGLCIYAAWDYHRISQIYRPPAERASAYRTATLDKLRGSWLFRSQVEFAELTTTELTRDNAGTLHAMALRLLHFSPEPRVIEKVIESAVLLGKDDVARFHILRYRAAFPEHYARWARRTAATPS